MLRIRRPRTAAHLPRGAGAATVMDDSEPATSEVAPSPSLTLDELEG